MSILINDQWDYDESSHSNDASKLVNYDILFPGKLEDVLIGVLERDICQDKPIHISPEQLAIVSMECQ